MNEVEREAGRKANQMLNRWLQASLSDLMPEQTGHRNTRNRRAYLYWEAPDQRMFCYSPWKDHEGNYFTWVMKPVGRGARSGKARRWRRLGKVVASRTRKTARKRAKTRYENWLKYMRNRSLPMDERE